MKELYAFSINDIPTRVDYIYTDSIDDFTLVCTPLSMNGIHLLTKESLNVLDKCNGTVSCGEIARLTGYDKNFVTGSINAFWQNRLIKINGIFSSIIKKEKETPSQIDVWFHITNKCNLDCPYCYINKSNEAMDCDVAYRAIDNLANSALLYGMQGVSIKFSGGEPLLCFDLIKTLVVYAKKWNNRGVKFSFHILTNGTLISEPIVQYLKQENITISLSLDGIGDWNDKVRFFKNGKGSFRQIEKAIKLLRKYRMRPFILTTVTVLNLRGLPDLTRYFLKNKFSFRFSLYRELGVSKESLRNYNTDVIKVLHQCYDICEDNLPTGDFSLIHQLCDIKLTKSRKRACGIGTKGIGVGHRGEIALCQSLFDNPVGHINKDDSLTAIRNQKQFSAKENIVDNYDSCKDCMWRYMCGGGCPVLTKLQYGKFNTNSPYCDVFKSCIPRLIRIMGIQMVRQYKATKNREGR